MKITTLISIVSATAFALTVSYVEGLSYGIGFTLFRFFSISDYLTQAVGWLGHFSILYIVLYSWLALYQKKFAYWVKIMTNITAISYLFYFAVYLGLMYFYKHTNNIFSESSGCSKMSFAWLGVFLILGLRVDREVEVLSKKAYRRMFLFAVGLLGFSFFQGYYSGVKIKLQGVVDTIRTEGESYTGSIVLNLERDVILYSASGTFIVVPSEKIIEIESLQ